jgi:hypothetical protein
MSSIPKAGRSQSETQAKGIDDSINNLLRLHKIPFKRVSTLDDVIRELKLEVQC